MIFVMLGTQDKPFDRLLKAIEKQIIKNNIKEKVIVQAGTTKYISKHMEIFDFITLDELQEYIKKSSLIITHGGVGSILDSLKQDKIVIAASRLKKYKEHDNDHQKEIIKEFVKLKYILELKDFNKLNKVLIKSKTFKPKKYISNNNNFKQIIKDFIN